MCLISQLGDFLITERSEEGPLVATMPGFTEHVAGTVEEEEHEKEEEKGP